MIDNEQSKINKPSIFLCLSGGGFRATLFHYGCLKRLNELGILGYVYGTSATSGGAITAALLQQNRESVDKQRNAYIYNWGEFEKRLLNLVTSGALGQVNKLICAYIFYICGLLFLFFSFSDGICTIPFWIGLICLLFGIIGLNWIFYEVSIFAVFTLAVYFSSNISNFYFAPAIMCLIVGFIYHGRLFWLIRKMSDKTSDMRKKFDKHFGQEYFVDKNLFIKMCFQPSFLRIETMNVLAFDCERLNTLHNQPRIFLTAVNLCDGKEMVFTNSNDGCLLSLDSAGCGDLWDGYGSWGNKYTNIEVAWAVAASSAFPPVFLPVKIDDEHVFSDGGLVDNLAVKVPEAFSVYINPKISNSYGYNKPSFENETKFVLLLDGSHVLDRKQNKTWSRLKTFFRIFDITINAQGNDAKIAAFNFDHKKIDAWSISLQENGLEPDNFLVENNLVDFLPRIRTHLDKFTLQECAALAYYGYSMIDVLCKNNSFFDNLILNNPPPPLKFDEILPKEIGDWNKTPESLKRTLSDSHRRKFNIFSFK